MINIKLIDLKNAVRDWVATLSVDEIILNKELSEIFKRIEYKIQYIEGQYV